MLPLRAIRDAVILALLILTAVVCAAWAGYQFGRARGVLDERERAEREAVWRRK